MVDDPPWSRPVDNDGDDDANGFDDDQEYRQGHCRELFDDNDGDDDTNDGFDDEN